MTTTHTPRSAAPARNLRWGVGLAVVSAAAWFAWLGWDQEYWYDAAGNAHGPYETWQVLGCGVTLLAACVIGALRWHPFGPVAVMPIAFTAAWIATSAPADDQGLWPVGAIMVLVGTAIAATLIGAVLAPRSRRRRAR